jgi:hypothetical protein
VVLPCKLAGVTRLCFRFGLVPIVVFDWCDPWNTEQPSAEQLT